MSPSPIRSLIPAGPSEANQSPKPENPIQIDSEGTPLNEYNSEHLDLHLDDDLSEGQNVNQGKSLGDQGGEGTSSKKRKRHHKHKDKNLAEPSDSSKSSKSSLPRVNQWVKSQSRMAKEAAEKAEQQEERECYLRWNISASSSVLYTKPGQDSWDLFDACILPRDQASLLMNAPTRIEEHGAHTLMQMATFFRSLSMKCASYHRNQIAVDPKVGELLAKLPEKERMDQTHVGEMQTLIKEVQKLKSQLAAATEATEVAFSKGKKEGFEAGKEAGISGHAQGIEETQAGRITLEEHHQALASSRVSIARDFLKSGSFKTAVEIKPADFFNKGYRTCEAQLETLGGFADSFDRSRMDITLGGKLQPYPKEPAPADNEFSVLLDEIEPDP
ncbi:UNVERIFIED_CONTAM: hypothetical protein Sindi_1835600 [Sesamum indicum]